MDDVEISVIGLAKTYGSHLKPIEVVCGIGLEVHCGEVFGLVGPDGS